MTALLSLVLAASIAPASLRLKDVDRRLVTLPVPGRPTCVIFVAPDCPIANRLAPEIQRIVIGNPRVSFFLAYPQKATTVEVIRKHMKSFGLAAPAFCDPQFKLAKFAQATVTPEAVLFNSKGKPIYRGRINDLYTEHNVPLAKPTRHDLRDAIQAALAGRPVAEPYVAPVGCPIAFR